MALASISHPIDEWGGGGGGGRAGCAGLTRSVGFTVAILAQGTSWADAATQAFLQKSRILRTRCQLSFGIVHPTYSHPIVYEQLVTCVLQLLNPVPCIVSFNSVLQPFECALQQVCSSLRTTIIHLCTAIIQLYTTDVQLCTRVIRYRNAIIEFCVLYYSRSIYVLQSFNSVLQSFSSVLQSFDCVLQPFKCVL